MDLSIPLCVLSLLLIGFSYAQELVLTPSDPVIRKIAGSKFALECTTQGLADGENPELKWMDSSDNEIGGYDATRGYYTLSLEGLLILQFNSIKKGDEGVYTCQGTINGNLVEKGIQIELEEKITMSSPLIQNPTIGTDALIECKATGNKISVVWLTSARQRITIGGRFKREKLGLRIMNITEADNGVYVCMVRSSEGDQSEEFPINVTVTVPPSMKGPPVIGDPIVGQDFQMSCEADGTPLPKFVFRKDNTILDSERYKISETNEKFFTRGTMVIKKLEDTDEGDYTCEAVNKADKVSATVFIDTIVPPTIANIQNQTAAEGSSVELVCEARSDPAADVQWSVLGSDITIIDDPEEHITVETLTREETLIHVVTKKLKFSKLKPSNTNNYTCVAGNVAGTETAVGSVIVEFKPNFANTPYSKTYGWATHDTEIRCVVDAVPYPSITWMHKGQKIASNGYYTIKQEKGIRQLTGILTVSVNIENEETVFGTYTCAAVNMHGEANHTITLQKAVTPAAPIIGDIEGVTPTTIPIVIKPPKEHGGQPILDYKIVYYEEGKPEEKITRKADISVNPDEPRTQFLIEELKAKTKYLITVAARNAVGFGAEATVREETPAVQVPGLPVITSQGKSDNANSYMLKWERPRSGGAAITGYNIKFTQVELSTKDGGKEVSRMVGKMKTILVDRGELTSYKLEKLLPNANYELQLTAVNSIGESMAATHIFQTLPGGMTTPAQLKILEHVDTYENIVEVTGEGVPVSVSSSDTSLQNGAPSPTTPVTPDAAREDKERPMATGAIIGIIIAVIIILFIVIDVTFYFTKQCGILWTLKGKVAGGEGGGERTDAEAADHEKEAFIKEGKQDSEEPSAKENVDMVNETEKADEDPKDKELEPEDKEEKVETEPAPEPAKEAQEDGVPAGSPQTESAPPETSTEPAQEETAPEVPEREKDPKV